MRVAIARCLLGGGALLLAACSSYDSRWQSARPGIVGDPYAGSWEGRWTSSKHSGHGDRLQCILTPVAGKGPAYRADFKATWLKVFTSQHSVLLHFSPAKAGRPQPFAGSAKLSTFIGGGTYQCKGTLTPTQMKADYDATYDAGAFDLARMAPAR